MSANSSVCTYKVLEGPIHEVGLTESSRRAVDEMFALLETIHTELAKKEAHERRIFMLMDAPAGLLPLNYAFKSMQPYIQKYPTMRQATVALLIPPTPLLRTVSMVMRTVTPIRFFNLNERVQALAWLQEALAKPSKR